MLPLRDLRHRLGVRPVFKMIDTCAAEFQAQTPYLYSTYEAPTFGEPENEANPSDRKKIVILGGGPNRIGQGIEFDYCCCHACFALEDAGYETIMVNCNPETVSTDYDTSDRLYFEPLTAEDVIELVEVERRRGELLGLIVQFGGQTPLKLALGLQEAGVRILGTSPDSIDLAEDRKRFSALLEDLKIPQPASGTVTSRDEAREVAAKIGFPVMLKAAGGGGGKGMRRVDRLEDLESAWRTAKSEAMSAFGNDAEGQALLAEALRIDPNSALAKMAFERMEGVSPPGDPAHAPLDQAIAKYNFDELSKLESAERTDENGDVVDTGKDLSTLWKAVAPLGVQLAKKTGEFASAGVQLVASAPKQITNPKLVLHIKLIVKGLDQSVGLVKDTGKLLVGIVG